LWKAAELSCPGVRARKAPLRKHDGDRGAGFPQPVPPLGSAAAWVVWHASEIIIFIIALKLILNQRLYRGFCQPKQKLLQSKWGLQECVRNESFQNYSSIHETAGTALGYVPGVLR